MEHISVFIIAAVFFFIIGNIALSWLDTDKRERGE